MVNDLVGRFDEKGDLWIPVQGTIGLSKPPSLVELFDGHSRFVEVIVPGSSGAYQEMSFRKEITTVTLFNLSAYIRALNGNFQKEAT